LSGIISRLAEAGTLYSSFEKKNAVIKWDEKEFESFLKNRI